MDVIGTQPAPSESTTVEVASRVPFKHTPRARVVETEFNHAKTYLSKTSEHASTSVYSHVTKIIKQILQKRPDNAMAEFETLSKALNPTHQNQAVNPIDIDAINSRIQLLSFEHSLSAEAQPDIPSIMDLSHLWTSAGVSFGPERTYLLIQSIRQLAQTHGLKSVRLFGVVHGTMRDYVIAESEIENDTAETPKDREGISSGANVKQKRLSVETKKGVNKYTYFASSSVDFVDWKRLPETIPELLQTSRQIRKCFTGNLDSVLETYPIFNGTEADYLRCQIARISAATVLSPTGYYIFDEEADQDDESKQVIINPEFEGFSNELLINLASWCHHIPYILPQGRTVWEDNSVKPSDEEEGAEKDEQEEESGNAEREVGPAMLSLAQVDEAHYGQPSWTVHAAYKNLPSKFSPTVLRSLRWPGAHVIGYNDQFTNIYVGNGLKDVFLHIAPKLPAIQTEFVGTFILEIDPTVQQESANEETAPVEDVEEAEEEEE